VEYTKSTNKIHSFVAVHKRATRQTITVIPRLTKIIRSGITFVSRNVIRSEAAYVIRRLTSRCHERKQSSHVGGSPLCDVVSSFLCHTHTDGKDKLLEWPDRSCLLLYVSALPLIHSLAESIFVSRVRKTAKKIFVSRKIL
jgi:hypothetical protein